MAARAVNPRIAIIATADSAAERVWLEEFGAEYVCDVLALARRRRRRPPPPPPGGSMRSSL